MSDRMSYELIVWNIWIYTYRYYVCFIEIIAEKYKAKFGVFRSYGLVVELPIHNSYGPTLGL